LKVDFGKVATVPGKLIIIKKTKKINKVLNKNLEKKYRINPEYLR
jgi:hypothetical protein